MMKILLIALGLALTMAAIVLVQSETHSKETFVLDYDDMILLDAEELGEGDIGRAYNESVIPLLKKYVDSPAEIVEDRNPDGPSYKVTSQGKTYIIYSPEMEINAAQNWGNATFALFDIVNRQLKDSPYKFYAISGGHELGGMFLTQDTYERAIKSLKRKRDWPYLPDHEHPWYGLEHD